MTRRIRPIGEDDLAAVSTFLIKIFGPSAPPRFASPNVLRWKYIAPGSLWEGPRAFVLEQDGAIVAHAGLTPALFATPEGATIASLTIVDWAAEPSVAGAGVMLYAHLMRLAPTTFLIGGAEITRSIIPKLGFLPAGEAHVYSAWFRPLREFLAREKSWRAFQRLGHGMLNRRRRRLEVAKGWQAVPVARFDSSIDPILAGQPHDRVLCRRTVASLNHMLACPLVAMEGRVLTKNGATRGYFIVAYRGWDARVVDVNIDSDRVEDWAAAYDLAAEDARSHPQACRLRAMASVPMLRTALSSNGYWLNQREAVSLYDPKHRVPDSPIDVQYFESDSAFA